MLIGKPQTGGWPAHRYFNSSTGLDGKPYPRQTEEQMCEVRPRHTLLPAALQPPFADSRGAICLLQEMSDPKRMRDYIETAAGLKAGSL